MSNTSTHQKITAASLLVALGIIYGDIGTSPLYVMKAIVDTHQISELLVYGGISCVFWTLTFQTTFKYIILTLSADNHGEGGVFSLYALVKRFGKGKLVIPTILGATTLLADGIITPPISVASAVEGLEAVVPHLPTVPIVIAILSGLFIFQRFGTQKVGSFFGPAMLVWFSMLFVLGFSQIIHHPEILKALNPIYAYRLLTEFPHGFWILGAVFLCTTGAEALYSDLGHCGKSNIRITWIFVKISLVINYLGQGAWLMQSENQLLNGLNPFYEIMPQWFLIAGIIIATLAAIIASQALISGSFTLINEAISLNFWPRVSLKNPTNLKGQIYIPSINFLLWIGCVAVVLYFQNSSNMEAAYGLAITLAMMTTTLLLVYFLKYRLKFKNIFVIIIYLIFFVIELSFFIANLKKFPEGGFVTIIISSVFALIMYVVFYGRKLNNKFIRFTHLNTYKNILDELSKDDSIPKYATHLVYLSKADKTFEIEEKIMNSIFSKKPKRADVYWFLHINRTNDPFTLNYEIEELIDDKVIKIVINVGFRIQPRVELYFKQIIKNLVEEKLLNLHIRPDGSTKYNNEADFKFVILEKFLSVENELTFKEGLLLNSYFFLKRISLADDKAFGLDRSDVVVEELPIVYHPVTNIKINRKKVKMNKISYLSLIISFGVFAQKTDPINSTFSGFLETFYSYNSAEPISQASLPFLYNYNRHNEFTVNLALLKSSISYQNMYAKIGLQAGSYVTDNYANEPIKLLNEAYIGINFNPKTNLEVGILPSYIGFETATSHSNLTLTRSILAENSPYYLAGIKYNQTVSEKINFSIILSNGWQHIEKQNRKSLPALGTQLVYKPTEKATFNWSTFLGDEWIVNKLQTRFFNNLYADYQWNTKIRTITGFDYGVQKNDKNKFRNWLSPVFIGQYSMNRKWQTAFRAEYYQDTENLLIASEKPFKVFSSSVNLDFLPNDKAKIRTELRYLNPTEDLNSLEKNTFLWTTSFSFEF